MRSGIGEPFAIVRREGGEWRFGIVDIDVYRIRAPLEKPGQGRTDPKRADLVADRPKLTLDAVQCQHRKRFQVQAVGSLEESGTVFFNVRRGLPVLHEFGEYPR